MYTTCEGIARHNLDQAKFHDPRALRFHSASFWMRIAIERDERCSFTAEEVERISLGKELEDLALRARHHLSKIDMAQAKKFWEEHRTKLDCPGPQFSALEEERMKTTVETLEKAEDSAWSDGMSTLCPSARVSMGSLTGGSSCHK